MQEFLLALPILLFSLVAHEYAHGFAAMTQGDQTAYQLGRLTFNPIRHIDLWMTILVPAILWFATHGQVVFGGAKPVPVNPRNYRNYRRGDIIVSAAGIVTNLVLAVVCLVLSVVIGVLGGMAGGAAPVFTLLQRMMFWGIWLNLLLAFFNVIPIPPLDGSHLFYHVLPPRVGAKYREYSRYGMLVLMALVFFLPGVLWTLLTPAFMLYKAAAAAAAPFALGPLPL